MTKQTKTEKIMISLDYIKGEILEAIEKGDAISLFSAMYRIDGVIALCDLIDLSEVKGMFEADPLSDDFYAACEAAANIDKEEE